MKTVIMAGGRGTRISSVSSDIPKPMIKIEGNSVLEHELDTYVETKGLSTAEIIDDDRRVSPDDEVEFG